MCIACSPSCKYESGEMPERVVVVVVVFIFRTIAHEKTNNFGWKRKKIHECIVSILIILRTYV